MSLGRFVGTKDPVQVVLAGTDPVDLNVPDISGPVCPGIELDHIGGRTILWIREQEQVHTGGVPAEYGKLHTVIVGCCAQGKRFTYTGSNHIRATSYMKLESI